MKNLLVIGHTFPEPSTTAAGSRMMQLLQLFQEENYHITFASTAAISERTIALESHAISIKRILLNDVSFDEFIKELNPKIVLFDRYITEEQFGWRVTENCENALKILDTEDLHFLRKAREEAVKKNKTVSKAFLFSETAKRELASILRSDVSLIISEFEMELLQNTFKIPLAILYYLPFLVEKTTEKKLLPSFENRKNFVTIGNLLHAPNIDSVLQLKHMWPAIKEQLPKAELHIYGAYAPQHILQLHNKKEGFIIKGWTEHIETVLKNYRVQLAPLRFGAGLKGKLLDAMRFGLPSVTTAIGAEGMCGELPFGGSISALSEDFSKKAIQLYSNASLWNISRNNGLNVIEKRFEKTLFSEAFKKHNHHLAENIKSHRNQNVMGQIIQHQTMQGTKYMSKWIEAKNSANASRVSFE